MRLSNSYAVISLNALATDHLDSEMKRLFQPNWPCFIYYIWCPPTNLVSGGKVDLLSSLPNLMPTLSH